MLKDFSNLSLKISYDSGKDNVLRDFYIPVLSTANRYDRIAGFFSSSTLAVAARGMEAFIENGGTMRLVTCPRLSSSDVEAMKGSIDSLDSVIYKNFIHSYEDITDKFELDHVKALGWMIANNLLTIKIAVVRNNSGVCNSDEIERLGIMHQKVGVLYDQAGNALSLAKFLEIITSQKFSSVTKFLIGDEVHGMGADKTRNGLIDEYTYRLGLSATPQRWFDDAGSKLIEEYFGGKSFEFTIHDALTEINPITKKNFLVKFDYEPCFVSLTDNEIEEYKKLTEKIIKSKRYMDDKDTYLQMLRFKRADIEKNAVAKYDELERILDNLGNDISNMIIFVSDAQIDNVVQTLGKRGISTTKFTQEQGTAPMAKYGGLSERDYIISKFKSKDYQVLVAIKCLDEGIDIPSADTAIIMASSTNPREYVQRIGRIIRQAPNKYSARIYDMILEPDYYRLGDDKLAAVERRIFEKEMVRVKDLSQDAANSVTVLTKVYKVLEESKL